MKDFKNLIEMTYPGNIGFSEMVSFYQEATDSQIKEMETIIKKSDWNGFKRLIQKVLKVKLQ